MTYIVACDHAKALVDSPDPHLAVQQLKCKRCVNFSLNQSEWNVHDVRVYRASAEDRALFAAQHATVQPAVAPVPPRQRTSVEQLDWVNLCQ